MAKKNAKTEPVTVAPQRSVRKSFGDARKELAKVLQDEDAMYAIPWFLMVGEPGCNKSALLPDSGLAARPGSPNAYGLEEPFENHWWFFNDAVVIDMAENLFSGANDIKGGATKRSLVSRLLRRRAPSRGAWRSQLEELQNVRRRRPMDGVVLTVDVNRLRDLSAEDTGQLGRRGEAVAAQIRDAQYLLGVDFPVYVLLTNCEELQGFSNFTRALPEPMRDQIFGWSSPYETEIPYQSGMVDEAIAAMRESVCMSQIEMIPQVQTQKDRDALYLLPRELRMLTEPLRLYLDPLFKTASFKRGLPLRGIYLTAHVEDQPPSPPEAAADPDGMPPLPPGLAPEPAETGPVGRPRFVRQVFSEKIFQEPGLTHIDEKRNKEAAKTVLRARLGLVATFIICGIFMWLQSSLTQARVDDFGTMKTLLSDYQKTRAGAKRDPGARKDLEALKILANLSESQFETIFAPLSLGTGLSSDVSDAIGLAMSGLVGRPLLNLLRDKADSILSPALELESPRLDESDLPVGLARHNPKAQVASLHGFAGSVNELEGNFHKYERHGLMEVQSVYEYATGESLEGLAENSGLYGDALRTAKWPKMSFKGYEGRARVKLQLWMSDFHRDLFHGHPLKERLSKLRGLMDTIQALKGGETSHGRLRSIRDTIRGAKELLADGRSDWLLAKNFTGGAGPDYSALLSELNKSGFNWGKTEGQSRDFRDWREAFSDRNEREFQSLKGALLDFKLLQVTEKGVALNDEIKEIESALDAYFKQPYVIEDEEKETLGFAQEAGARNLWNSKLIQQVLSWKKSFEAYSEAKRPDLNPAVAMVLQKAAKEQYRRWAKEVIENHASAHRLPQETPRDKKSWTIQEKELLKETITNLGTQYKSVLTIVESVERVNRDLDLTSDSVMFNSLKQDALDRLEDVTSIRDSENLYKIRKDEFDWLKIGQPAGVAAFGARDLNDLNQRLAVFRSTVGTLARDYAQTLVAITGDLGEPFSADVRAVDWGAIIEVLDDHEKKVPGNDLEMLDRFIEDDLNKLQTGTCSDQLQKSVKSSQYDQSNFFKKKRHEAAASMLAHCKSLVRNLTIEGYVKLQRRFAEKLAGQFPFAGSAIQSEVNTGDVVEFYRMFDRYSSAFTVLLDSSSGQQPDLFGKDTEDVKRFIQQVERARPLFKNLLTSEDENPELVLDLRFRFRANEENEVNGNQIIEWRSIVGDAKIGHRDSKQTAQWKTNDGMSMCFRWAMNALFTPVRDQRDDNARVNGQTVCYKYDGRWALMRMLKSHESTPADRGRRTFLRPHTLRFETETGPSSSGNSSASLLVNDTRVYVRIEAFIPGAKQAMKLPEFPRRAPELGAEFLRKNGLVATGGGKEL